MDTTSLYMVLEVCVCILLTVGIVKWNEKH